MIWGVREHGKRIQFTGQSDSGNLNNFGASSFFTRVYADTASLASPAHPGGRETTSNTLALLSCALQKNLAL